ncbi:MAG TPA: PD-(D/E)XK nuclease family protein [Candidatus Babeliales bacterium]|nr:PD-(D/E)XK nuclease family protein [Candidatus Babeliales bacterium]
MFRTVMPQLSWSKINLFMQCQRCFYKVEVLKRKHPGVDPDAFALNNAVDNLWKKESDIYREKQLPHPIMTANNIIAVPYNNPKIRIWRDYRAGGIRCIDTTNNFELFGVIDDIWINQQEELIIVDYKATEKHKNNSNNSNQKKWDSNNNNQMAFYGSLLKNNGYRVHNIGYFVQSSANRDKPTFNQRLEFETLIQPCVLNDGWVETTLGEIRQCINQEKIPEATEDCVHCKFDLINHNKYEILKIYN